MIDFCSFWTLWSNGPGNIIWKGQCRRPIRRSPSKLCATLAVGGTIACGRNTHIENHPRNRRVTICVRFPDYNHTESGVRDMPLNELLPGSNPARDDVQQTDFGYDVVSRYICNNWQEIVAAQGPGAYPFDVVVIGAGMFGGYCAEKLYRLGKMNAFRILMLDAGAFLLQSHIQNLPQQLGGKVGGPNYLRTRDDATGAQNVIWGMPWISNEGFPGLAYCIGGRSLFWGGWSPPLTDADLANWPGDVTAYLKSATGYASTELEIGTATTTDFITNTALFGALLEKIKASIPLDGITEAAEAPLAVAGEPPRSGLFAFDKFSSAPFIMEAIRNDVAVNSALGDASRRIFLVPRVQVHRLNLSAAGDAVTSLDLSVAGARRQLDISRNAAVIIAD